MGIEANYNDGGLTSLAPYYNDWDETKKYLQMLFTPGRALQARELTQVQTMLQTQIDRFGSHIFENGSPVAGGLTTVHTDVYYARLDPNAAYDNLTDYTLLNGTTLTDTATGVKARVIHVDETVTVDDPYPVIFFHYTATSEDGNTTRFTNDSQLSSAYTSVLASSSSAGGIQVQLISAAQESSLGQADEGGAYLVSIDQGIFFVDGFFILVDNQTYAPVTTVGGVRVYTPTPTVRVGLTTVKSVVDIGEDSSLGDPANGSPNFAAPGAARLKFEPTLSQQTYTDGDSTISNLAAENFIELIRIVDGSIRKRIKYPIYSDLDDTLARRTYDESGSYTVKAFRANARESARRRTLTIPSLDSGAGYEVGEIVDATAGSSSSSSGGTLGLGIVVSWDASTDKLVLDMLQSAEFVAGDYIVGEDSGTTGYCTNVSTEHIDVVLDPGKAYIFGRELETIAPEVIPVEKAREFDSVGSDTTTCTYGLYFICDSIAGVFDINEQETITLHASLSNSSSSSSDSGIGTAKVKHMLYDSANGYYRVYVYDVQLNSGQSIGNTEILVGADTDTYAYIDDTNGKVSGSTKLYGKGSSASIFALPNTPIQGNLASAVYHYRLYQTGVTVAGGTATFNMPATSTGDLYYPTAGGSTSSNLRQNYILVNDTDGSDISADITQGNRSGSTLTLSGLTSHNGDSVSLISVVQSSSLARTKTLESSYLIPVDLSLDGNNEIALGLSDVNALVSVLDVADSNADVTSKFILDNGQRDNVYDYAKLKLAPGQTVNGASGFTITVDYFTHSGSGPLTYNSYAGNGLDYDEYPEYVSPNTGEAYALRDCVDFRPAKDNQYVGSSSSATQPGTIDYAKVICPLDSLYRTFTATTSYYKGRIDKIVLRKDKSFDVIKGIPDLLPEPPNDDPLAMTLYNVEVPPYTGDVSRVNFKYVDNRRYTMRDIGKLRQRISNVEYYTSLSLLEQNADSLTIKDSNGAERFKNGIMVDSFNGHQVGNVGDRAYAAAMDFKEGILRPTFLSDSLSMDFQSGSSSGVEQKGDQITLTAGSFTPLVEQPVASTCLSVNPFNITSWLGHIELSPESDTWYDSTTRPKVQVNYEGSADAWEKINNGASTTGYSTEWNDWETYWTGSVSSTINTNNAVAAVKFGARSNSVVQTTTQTQTKQTRSGFKTYYDVDTTEESKGERTVNVKVIPYMRAATITATATGMKPNTRLYPFFGDTDVSAYCTSNIQSDAAGEVVVTFNLPGGQFEAGTRMFRLTDEPDNILVATTTAAEALFTSRGMLEEKEELIVSTKTARMRRESVEDFRTLSGPRTTVQTPGRSNQMSYTDGAIKDRISGQRKLAGYGDPLAQSFLVDPSNHPNGVFLSSVDLYFREKDDSLPVTIDLRPSVNGYPSSTHILPFSTVTLKPNQVNTTENPDPTDSNSYTRFEFPSYVYLAPGEYMVTVRSNSDTYCAFIAEMGQTRIGSSERITEQPYAGSLFKSQNASTWTADQYSDLTFRLNRCVFSTTTPGVVVYNNAAGGADTHADLVQFTTEDIDFSVCPISYTYDIAADGGSPPGTFPPATPNRNMLQTSTKQGDNAGDIILKATFQTTDAAVSPILDEERCSVIVVENIINNSTTGETDAEADLVAGAKARYITRRVTLEDDAEATDLKVYLTASIPDAANVHVYYKVLAAEDDTPFGDRPWVEMTEVNGSDLTKARGIGEYLEYQFKSGLTDINGDDTVTYGDYDDFQTYAIKIVMVSTNSAQPPLIKDLRAIAVL